MEPNHSTPPPLVSTGVSADVGAARLSTSNLSPTLPLLYLILLFTNLRWFFQRDQCFGEGQLESFGTSSLCNAPKTLLIIKKGGALRYSPSTFAKLLR